MFKFRRLEFDDEMVENYESLEQEIQELIDDGIEKKKILSQELFKKEVEKFLPNAVKYLAKTEKERGHFLWICNRNKHIENPGDNPVEQFVNAFKYFFESEYSHYLMVVRIIMLY